ncbi:MAG: lipase [Myxococcales bacterium]|nr:lipase [Myxococcales bacterium]
MALKDLLAQWPKDLAERVAQLPREIGELVAQLPQGAAELITRVPLEIVTGDAHGRIGWMKRGDPPLPPTEDATGEFFVLLQRLKGGEVVLPHRARGYVYLTIPGLFAERYPGYLLPTEKRLEERGCHVRRIPINTDRGIETNAELIASFVRDMVEADKRVVLIGHSKGGVDGAAAIAMYPEVARAVEALVSMQAPYGGAPGPHDLVNCPPLHDVIERLLGLVFRGDPGVFRELTYDAREAFIRAHPMPAQVRVVSLATSAKPMLSLTTAGPLLYVNRRYQAECDGLVCPDDAEIPGSRVVRLRDIDHAGPAFPNPLYPVAGYNPRDVTEALVTLAVGPDLLLTA